MEYLRLHKVVVKKYHMFTEISELLSISAVAYTRHQQLDSNQKYFEI
jgi:hypothetical protein